MATKIGLLSFVSPCSVSRSQKSSAKIYRARRVSLFRHDGCKLKKKLEVLFVAPFVAHVLDSKELTHRTWNENPFLPSSCRLLPPCLGKIRNPAFLPNLTVSLFSCSSPKYLHCSKILDPLTCPTSRRQRWTRQRDQSSHLGFEILMLPSE